MYNLLIRGNTVDAESIQPGCELNVRVDKPGVESSQGVTFLPDGSMVVIEGGGDSIGREVRIRVRRVLRTSAGALIYADLCHE